MQRDSPVEYATLLNMEARVDARFRARGSRFTRKVRKALPERRAMVSWMKDKILLLYNGPAYAGDEWLPSEGLSLHLAVWILDYYGLSCDQTIEGPLKVPLLSAACLLIACKMHGSRETDPPDLPGQLTAAAFEQRPTKYLRSRLFCVERHVLNTLQHNYTFVTTMDFGRSESERCRAALDPDTHKKLEESIETVLHDALDTSVILRHKASVLAAAAAQLCLQRYAPGHELSAHPTYTADDLQSASDLLRRFA